MTFLETKKDMRWLAEAHLRAAKKYNFALLEGNEDCPTKISLYIKNHVQCVPTVYEYDGEHYRLVSLGERKRFSKLRSHVGMRYKHLFSFQLLDNTGVAVATIDYENGFIDRVLISNYLKSRQFAIIRLAEKHRTRNA